MSTEEKKEENTGSAYRGSLRKPNYQLVVWGHCKPPPPNFLSAQSNSGASGEVNYKYLKFISCVF